VNLGSVKSLVLVGAGNMGLALARGWIEAGLNPQSLVLVDPSPRDEAMAFSRTYDVALHAQMPQASPAIIVLAVKPQIAQTVMGGFKAQVGPQTLVISVVAGIVVKALGNALGTDKIVRTIPNTPAQVGKGATGAFAGPGVSEAEREQADALLCATGITVWLKDETDIDAVTAVSGSGPAYVFFLVEAMAAAGENEGLSKDAAMKLARQTVIGAAALMQADSRDAAILRENVTSPNGTTAAALDILMGDDGLKALMARAMGAARKRSVELGK
jgi:pyrroline-5-carboxylate reductase